MRQSSSSHRYQHVFVLHVYDHADPRATKSSNDLEAVLNGRFNYRVLPLNVGSSNTGFNKHGNEWYESGADNQTAIIEREIAFWVRLCNEKAADVDADSIPMIVCYFGHGFVKYNVPSRKNELWAGSDSKPPVMFNFTQILNNIFSECKGDLLLITECCHAEKHGMKPRYHPVSKKFELVAAGEGIVGVKHNYTDFMRRLTKHLWQVKLPTTWQDCVKAVLKDTDKYSHAPGYSENFDGDEDIVLHPL